MDNPIAHDIEAKQRTDDVRLKEVSPFSKMPLSVVVRKGLEEAGFMYPTVIQAAAIPIGKAGMDLLVQSKSGTGKTLIFCTVLLEAYSSKIREPQSLIVVPTREIAVQIESVLNQIGRFCQGFRAICVIGGLDITDDRKRLQGAKSIVGTPGRLLHLIHNGVLNTANIRLLILDEADKMYTQSFRQDLQRILIALPSKRQTIACSATFCDALDEEIAKIMHKPLLISTEQCASILVGIKQFAYELREEKTSILEMNAKLAALNVIFGRFTFKQCLIFASTQLRANSYRNHLEQQGWPCELITGAQDQKTRLEMFQKFRDFKTRILIATDLMARGIDSEYVNLVINLELPTDVVTYLHRIGRAGRFGSHGIAITFIASERDRTHFGNLLGQVGNGMQILRFPQSSPAQQSDEERDIWDFSDFSTDCEYYGCFGSDHLVAPLASSETDSSYPIQDLQANKENLSDNKAHVYASNSSIDTKTFQIASTSIHLMDMLNDHCVENAANNNVTPESRQSSSQILPTSNTIDDASSIVADSVCSSSSQQDASRYQSILMQKVAIPTLVEFLVDQKSEKDGTDGTANEKAKEPIDLFDDYRRTLQQQEESESLSTAEKAVTKMQSINFKSLLIDQPIATKDTKNGVGAAQRDIYSDYANFDGDEASSSSVSLTNGVSESIDKATFILSVATPSQACDSLEEFRNSSLNVSQIISGVESNDASLPEVKHFTSPVQNHSIPDVVPPPIGYSGYQKQMNHVGAQVEMKESPKAIKAMKALQFSSNLSAEQPTNNYDNSSSRENNMTTATTATTSSAGNGSSSNTARGISSGFDENATESTSSGIEASEEDENDAEFANNNNNNNNNEYSGSSVAEANTNADGSYAPPNVCSYTDECDESNNTNVVVVAEKNGFKENSAAGNRNESEEESSDKAENESEDDGDDENDDDDDDDDDDDENYFENENKKDAAENSFQDDDDDNNDEDDDNDDNEDGDDEDDGLDESYFENDPTLIIKRYNIAQNGDKAAAKGATKKNSAIKTTTTIRTTAFEATDTTTTEAAAAATTTEPEGETAAATALEAAATAAIAAAAAATARYNIAREEAAAANNNNSSSNNKTKIQEKRKQKEKKGSCAAASVSESKAAYDAAYKRWVQIYWQQLNMIQTHVKYSVAVRQQQLELQKRSKQSKKRQQTGKEKL